MVREQYALTQELLLKHKDKVQELGDQLLENETMNLPMIIDVLGSRPYGMNESMSQYLDELNERKAKDDKAAAEKEAQRLAGEADAAQTELSKGLEDKQDEASDNKEQEDKERPNAETTIIDSKEGEGK